MRCFIYNLGFASRPRFLIFFLYRIMDAEAVSARGEELENGEIVSDDDAFDEVYVPLERPTQSLPVPVKALVESDVDDNERPESSDSDSDGASPSKIRKKVNASLRKHDGKSNKRKIWCSVLEAEAVANNLTGCKLDEQHGYVSYDCPTRKPSQHYNRLDYDYSDSRKESHYGGLGKRNNKGQIIPGRRPFRNNGFNNDKAGMKRGSVKHIPPISDSATQSEEKLAKEIADRLNEEKCELILKTIEVLGEKVAISLFNKTREIESTGGLLIMNGSRRRTSGGVFFYLLKTSDELTDEQRKLIFSDDKRDTAAQKKSLARKIRKQRSAKLKESLSKDDFPTLLSRTEMAIKEYKERKKAEESSEMENPPPSPATDGRDCSSDGEDKFNDGNYDKAVPAKTTATATQRELVKYDDDDDFFGGGHDDMELL